MIIILKSRKAALVVVVVVIVVVVVYEVAFYIDTRGALLTLSKATCFLLTIIMLCYTFYETKFSKAYTSSSSSSSSSSSLIL